MNRAIILLALVLATLGLATCQQQRISAARAGEVRATQELRAALVAHSNTKQQLLAALSATTVVTKYVDRVQLVRERGATVIKEIPVYVTPTADAACAIPAGFVRVHNAAAEDTPLGGAAGDADAAPSGVALSAVAEVTAANYGTCHELAAQVEGLQDYIRGQREAQP
ncbi:hypothetical protein AB8E26_06555 [Stenotrophomonas rhizophila]